MNKRVVVAMSGGVDSAVAAAILKDKGFEVIGMTMCFSGAGEKYPARGSGRPSCCGLSGIEDARRVCHTLGIKHYVLNFSRILQEKVVDNFCSEYLSGRTPNPCVLCNQYVKFTALLNKARALDARYLATGHYARITGNGPFSLEKGRDSRKDQSYFLYRLSQQQLKHILFPLGGYTKEQVRALARKRELPVAEKPGSQEICFLPDNDYRSFLKKRLGQREKCLQPGPVVDRSGNIIGEHKGCAFYTVGQREGLGIALGRPAYIINIDAPGNRITVGSKEDAFGRSFLVENAHFILKAPKIKIAAKVKIRYNSKEAGATILPLKGAYKVVFTKPQFAITPGQSAVFYQKGAILGGGLISRVLD